MKTDDKTNYSGECVAQKQYRRQQRLLAQYSEQLQKQKQLCCEIKFLRGEL